MCVCVCVCVCVYTHLEKEMAIHFSILAWKIPLIEEPGRLTVHGIPRVWHNLATKPPCICIYIYTNTHTRTHTLFWTSKLFKFCVWFYFEKIINLSYLFAMDSLIQTIWLLSILIARNVSTLMIQMVKWDKWLFLLIHTHLLASHSAKILLTKHVISMLLYFIHSRTDIFHILPSLRLRCVLQSGSRW